MSRCRYFLAVVLFVCISLQIAAQVAPPPPPPQGGYPDPYLPRRQWTFAIHGGLVGYSPSRTNQVSGNAQFTRVAVNNGINQLVDETGRTKISIIANTSLGLSAGTIFATKDAKFFHTIEGKFEQNKACYTFAYPFAYQLNGGISDQWVMFDKYLNYGLAYQFTFATNGFIFPADYWYIRGAFSRTFFHRDEPPNVITAGRFRDYTENGTGMYATTTQVRQNNSMVSFELGVRSFSPEWDRSFDFGFAAHVPFATSYTERYEFIQNNNSVGVSEVVFDGSTYMLNMRYTFNFKPKEKPVDTTTATPDIYVHTDTTREVDVQESFTVHNKRIKVTVWDRNEVDGDIVTLFMNDELVKKNLRLKKRKKRFTVKLKPGSNILVMYAENLGEIPPNTAAMQIKDGRKKRNINLVSDNGKSGAVEIIYVPK